MLGSDTKKMYIPAWKYTIIRHAMSIRLVEGASEGCRPKLPRWPFSAPAAPKLRARPWIGSMVGSHAQRVKSFCAMPRIFGALRTASLVVAVLPPASFLAPAPHGSPAHRTVSHRISLASSGTRVNTGERGSTGARAKSGWSSQ